MSLDRWVALVFLVISIVYGIASYHYPLLPFERNMPFLPNTLPLALSVLGGIFALLVLLNSSRENPLVSSLADIRKLRIGTAASLVGAMILYALLLRPVGFLIATVLFLVGTCTLLGERRFYILIPVAVFTACGIWYLVQQVLGIFLRPLPAFILVILQDT